MGLYKNTNGVLTPVAGRGKAEYGASTVRKGTATYTGATIGSYPIINVTFDTPMPDADYEIFFDYDEASGHGELQYMGFFGVYKRTAPHAPGLPCLNPKRYQLSRRQRGIHSWLSRR